MQEIKYDQKYIKMSYTDFSTVPIRRLPESHFRSLEAYLIRNNRKYNIDGEDCIIYVNDKEDAMSLGFHFNFKKIMYFDGAELLSITLFAKNQNQDQNKGPSIEMIDNNTGEKITTLKKLRGLPYEEAKKHCLEKKEIIKRGILTKKELEIAINENKLTEICILRRSYFDRQEIANFIKSKKK